MRTRSKETENIRSKRLCTIISFGNGHKGEGWGGMLNTANLQGGTKTENPQKKKKFKC